MKRNRAAYIPMAIIFVIFISISAAQAATFNVSTVTEFQTALTIAATNGENDTINVAAGTYTLAATLTYSSWEDYSIVISGANRRTTVLSSGSAMQILSVTTTQPDASVLISDMAFQNGSTTGNGGGISVITAAAGITLDGLEVSDCSATGDSSIGGGANLQTETGNMTITDCTFLRNNCFANVGGLYAGTVSGTIQLLQSTFDSNQVSNTGPHVHYGDGGGAMLYSDGTSDITVSENVFTGNSGSGNSADSTPDGGGIMTYQLGISSILTVDNNSFIDNQAQLGGGGCFSKFNISGRAVFRNNSFESNQTVVSNGGGAYLQFNDGELTYTGNTHRNNQSAEDGGGAWINQIAGTADIYSNTFISNQAVNNGGGAMISTESAEISIYKNIFSSNSSGNVGGGLSYAATQCSLNLYNNTFYGNDSEEAGGIYLYADQGSVQATMRNNILWNDQPNELAWSFGSATGSILMTYSNVENGTGETWFGTGCIATDPMFVNPAENEFALSWDNYPASDTTRSPCIDTADPAISNDTDETQADMGAIAFLQSSPTVTVSDISLSCPGPLQPGDNVTVTVDAAADDASDLYYKFYYCGNYGTQSYDTSPWNVVQAYSASPLANYSFSEAGSYVIVVRVTANPANEPAALPIIGGVVTAGGNSQSVNFTGFSSSSTGALSAGTPVTFTVGAGTTASDPIYYQFYYCADYGTAAYGTSPWIIKQPYSTNNQASFSFPSAGNYVVVVRSVIDPADEPAVLPIIGGVVAVE